MAIFGRDGTVRNRLKTNPARDEVRAKTGSLSGVATIVGIAQTQAGQTLAFSLLINDLYQKGAHSPIWNQMVDALVQTCPANHPTP